ncbi:uncharacterized protein YALI1_C03360g [Yarrowia lipolytica]|uniref:Uncharacterized protein n=1 Tax=Yarrowia lipolytica TaxID=4952 RepID=A0A1D8N9B5_YARLL|nr:hypothetical protein YALI1_C03360g [Yarrowia lipolytica]
MAVRNPLKLPDYRYSLRFVLYLKPPLHMPQNQVVGSPVAGSPGGLRSRDRQFAFAFAFTFAFPTPALLIGLLHGIIPQLFVAAKRWLTRQNRSAVWVWVVSGRYRVVSGVRQMPRVVDDGVQTHK